ncbi:MAG: hypothetical protein FJW30_22310 [Acidobacteria bacterium]|nr:hypothetical protein [Acidobacteriota bacterium]
MDKLRHLQQASRALRQAESTAQWTQILADAAAPFADAVLFFRVDDGRLLCEAARGACRAPKAAIPAAAAPAFAQAIESKESVFALHAPSQLTAEICGVIDNAAKRALLVPLTGRTRVLAVLLAESAGGVETHALELLLTLAAASLEMRRDSSAAPLIAPAPESAVDSPRAARFAASAVSAMLMNHGEAVAAGRASGNLYDRLRGPIDGARAEYAEKFVHPGETKSDFLHREIVERIARHDLAALGAGYPGPLA